MNLVPTSAADPAPTPAPTQGGAPALDFVLELRNVTKVYRMGTQDVHALAGVSVRIPRGGFWAIMGASGSGKSTMLNVLGCLDRPTSGQYLLENQDVAQMQDDALSDIRLKHLGFIFQNFNLIPQLTVAENIELPLYYLGWEAEKASARAAVLAEMVGLGHRLGHRPTELSGGQQQRVAIARSLSNDPSILLADEPTGNLDSKTGEQIMALLEKLNGEGRTIVMVTHESDIAAHARTRIHMKDGLVHQVEGEI